MSVTLGNANIGDIYYGATKITDAYLGSTHVYQSLKPITLTLCATEGGTLTADIITGYPGDSVQLSTAYNTYWRFSGYAKAGDGTLSNNTYTFGEDDEQIVSAYFKPNAFTATGGWEKGSNVTVSSDYQPKSTNVAAKYAIHGSHTGDVPDSWYSTSNRWKPSNASAYSIQLKPYMRFNLTAGLPETTAAVTACSLIGSTQTQTASYLRNTRGSGTSNYSKNFTSTAQGVNYGISAKLSVTGYYLVTGATAQYVANSTTGTWSATGYAP